MKLLVLSIVYPYPSVQGSSLRMAATLEALARCHEIHLLAFSKTDLSRLSNEASQFCKEVHIVKVKRLERLLNGFFSLFSSIPISVGIWHSGEMKRKIQQVCSKTSFDAIFLFDIKMALYHPFFPHNIRTYVDLDILYSRYYQSKLTFSKGFGKIFYSLEKRRMEKYERKTIETAFACFIASEVDRARVPERNKKKIRILPNVIDVKSYTYHPPSLRKGKQILFTGRFSYAPNIDGATFFCEQIFPDVKKQVADATFWIVGANPTKTIRELGDGENVFVTGFVENMRDYLQDAKVFVCPLRFGGGTRLKILEAMAAGLPVVSTTAGCEGLEVKNGVHLFIEDAPIPFAKRVAEILEDKIACDEMCNNARALVEQHYSRESLKIEGLTDSCKE